MLLRHVLRLLVGCAAAATVHAAASNPPEALLVIAGDQHSAYERTAQFVALVDGLKAGHPGIPLAVLIDGDAFEYGNAVARRTSGAIDFAMFAALAQRAPTVINLGNHEPEFFDVAETVRRLAATGAKVISGNLCNSATGKPYAPASVRLMLGAREAVIVGIGTDRLATYRLAIRPQLDLADPVAWARQNLRPLLNGAALPIVLSHAGLRADRALLEFVPENTLFAGAHDHLRFVHRDAGLVYFHSGSWMEFVSIARLRREGGELHWDVDQVPLASDAPVDPALAQLVRETLLHQLTPEETAVIGRSTKAMGPGEAALFAVEAVRLAADADAALIGGTTFGAGLPAGAVTQFEFDGFVRFDGTLFVAEIDGLALQKIMGRANQGPATPFAERAGENLVAVSPEKIDGQRRYRFVTTDWVARNSKIYFEENPPVLTERPELKLKAAVKARLQSPAQPASP